MRRERERKRVEKVVEPIGKEVCVYAQGKERKETDTRERERRTCAFRARGESERGGSEYGKLKEVEVCADEIRRRRRELGNRWIVGVRGVSIEL